MCHTSPGRPNPGREKLQPAATQWAMHRQIDHKSESKIALCPAKNRNGLCTEGTFSCKCSHVRLALLTLLPMARERFHGSSENGKKNSMTDSEEASDHIVWSIVYGIPHKCWHDRQEQLTLQAHHDCLSKSQVTPNVCVALVTWTENVDKWQ